MYVTVWFSCHMRPFTPAEQSCCVLTQCQIWCDCNLNHFWIIFTGILVYDFSSLSKQFIVLANGTFGVSCEWEIASDINESQAIFSPWPKVDWFYEIDLNDLCTCKVNSRLHSYTIAFNKSHVRFDMTGPNVWHWVVCFRLRWCLIAARRDCILQWPKSWTGLNFRLKSLV